MFANFVASLDGIVAIDPPRGTGAEISGGDAHDRAVMGMLRAVADAVVIGAGNLRAEGDHVWTAERVCPELAPAYAALRASLGKLPALILDDGTARLHCRWWNLPFMEKYFAVGDEVFVFGKPISLKPRAMDHPETEVVEAGEENFIHINRIVPVYPLTEGLPQRWLRGLIWRTLEQFERILRINLTGAVNVAHAFGPAMAERRSGTFLFIASVAGQIGSQTRQVQSSRDAQQIVQHANDAVA